MADDVLFPAIQGILAAELQAQELPFDDITNAKSALYTNVKALATAGRGASSATEQLNDAIWALHALEPRGVPYWNELFEIAGEE